MVEEVLGYFTEVTEAETQSKNTLFQVKVHLSKSVKVSVKVLWRSFLFDQMILCFYCQIKVMNGTKSICFFTAGTRTRSSLWAVEPSRRKLDLRSELTSLFLLTFIPVEFSCGTSSDLRSRLTFSGSVWAVRSSLLLIICTQVLTLTFTFICFRVQHWTGHVVVLGVAVVVLALLLWKLNHRTRKFK